jgi:Rad3-related DNA helicase
MTAQAPQEFTDTGRFRRIEEMLGEVRGHQAENARRLTEIEKVLIRQEEHAEGLKRAFTEIAEIKADAKAEIGELKIEVRRTNELRNELHREFDVLIARARGAWAIASIVWAVFGAGILGASGWMLSEVMSMRDAVARHDFMIAEFIKRQPPGVTLP